MCKAPTFFEKISLFGRKEGKEVIEMTRIRFPRKPPIKQAKEVREIQNLLLEKAERLLGSRDANYIILDPDFGEGGPIIVFPTVNNDVRAKLSKEAAYYWPTFVYELSHETVHFLNPVRGPANWLEEGIAVEFSVKMSKELTTHSQKPDPKKQHVFYEAMKMVNRLSSDVFDAAGKIRKETGALSAATFEDLQHLFPNLDEETLKKLAETFPIRLST